MFNCSEVQQALGNVLRKRSAPCGEGYVAGVGHKSGEDQKGHEHQQDG